MSTRASLRAAPRGCAHKELSRCPGRPLASVGGIYHVRDEQWRRPRRVRQRTPAGVPRRVATTTAAALALAGTLFLLLSRPAESLRQGTFAAAVGLRMSDGARGPNGTKGDGGSQVASPMAYAGIPPQDGVLKAELDKMSSVFAVLRVSISRPHVDTSAVPLALRLRGGTGGDTTAKGDGGSKAGSPPAYAGTPPQDGVLNAELDKMSSVLALLRVFFSRSHVDTSAVPLAFRLRGGTGGDTTAKGDGGSKAGIPPAYAGTPPHDGVLYEDLEVHWGASARDIRKSYYRLAVKHHPDKRPGDPQAEERFKRVGEAYSILQDDKLREKYHRHGLAALHDDGVSCWGDNRDDGGGYGGCGGRGWSRGRIDPMEVFRRCLGEGRFDHLIGPLSPRMVPVRDPDYHYNKSKALAEYLERRLEVDVQGDTFFFDRAAWAEALQLREQPMGREILATVGYVYKNYALRSLGKLAPSPLQPEAILGKLRFYSNQAHRVNNLLSAVSSTTRLYVHLHTRDAEVPSAEEETITMIKKALWLVHRADVEHTVQRACKMVLRDPRVSPTVRKKRAEALMRLSRVFTAAAEGKPPDPGTSRFPENAFDPMAGTGAAMPPPASSDTPFWSGSARGGDPYGDDDWVSPTGWEEGGTES